MNKISSPTLWLSLTAIGLLSGPMSMTSEEAVSYDKAKKAELRELATTYFGVLPDAMPGSENDNDHRRHLGEKLDKFSLFYHTSRRIFLRDFFVSDP